MFSKPSATRRWRSCLAIVGLLAQQLNSPAQTNFAFAVDSPVAGSIVQNNLSIRARVTATFEIQFVIATVANQQTNLAFNEASSSWTANLVLSGLPRGTQKLILKATDAYNNSAQTEVSFYLDRPPVLNVTTAEGFTRPQVRLMATATDDDPTVGVLLSVGFEDPVQGAVTLATGTNGLDTVADLSAQAGSKVTLYFRAIDSLGQGTWVDRTFDVISNPNVLEIDRISGIINDVSSDRILFTETNALKVKSRSTGLVTVLVNRADLAPQTAALTPGGAVFVSGILPAAGELYEARGDALMDLGPYGSNLKVTGSYAIWMTPSGQSTLILRDLVAGTNAVVSQDGSGYSDLAANGVVVYSQLTSGDQYVPHQVFFYRNGRSVQITTDSNVVDNIACITDGTNIVYEKVKGLVSDLAVFNEEGEGILASNLPVFSSHLLSAGWTAFVKPGSGGAAQVWTRSPSGALSQRTFWGVSSDLYSLSPEGEIMYVVKSQTSPARLYLGPSDRAPQDFGNWNFGIHPIWVDGRWYAILEGSLLQFVSPVSMTSPTWATSREFSFHLAVENGKKVIIQESTNLFDWTNVATNQSGSSDLLIVIPAPSNSDAKFYRCVCF